MRLITLGRDASNDIVLNSNHVSRHHAQIILMDNSQVLLQDLGSRNGTFVNGKKIHESFLNKDDMIACANSMIEWQQYVYHQKDNVQSGRSPVATKDHQFLNEKKGAKSFDKRKFGFLAITIGIIFMIISFQDSLFTKTIKYRVDPGAYGLPDAYNIMGPVYDIQKKVDTQKRNAILLLGIASLVTGGILLASSTNQRLQQNKK